MITFILLFSACCLGVALMGLSYCRKQTVYRSLPSIDLPRNLKKQAF